MMDHAAGERGSIQRKLVFAQAIPFQARLESVDVEELRRTFGRLFDQAALAVEATGYSLDDSVVERFVRCRDAAEREWVATVDSLSSRDRFFASVLSSPISGVDDSKDVRITEVIVHAYIEHWQ